MWVCDATRRSVGCRPSVALFETTASPVFGTNLFSAVYWLIERDGIHGPVNIAAPNPLRNDAFMRGLREAWGSRVGLPASRWMLEIGAFAMRTETELILKSRRVVPGILAREGFQFRFPD